MSQYNDTFTEERVTCHSTPSSVPTLPKEIMIKILEGLPDKDLVKAGSEPSSRLTSLAETAITKSKLMIQNPIYDLSGTRSIPEGDIILKSSELKRELNSVTIICELAKIIPPRKENSDNVDPNLSFVDFEGVAERSVGILYLRSASDASAHDRVVLKQSCSSEKPNPIAARSLVIHDEHDSYRTGVEDQWAKVSNVVHVTNGQYRPGDSWYAHKILLDYKRPDGPQLVHLRQGAAGDASKVNTRNRSIMASILRRTQDTDQSVVYALGQSDDHHTICEDSEEEIIMGIRSEIKLHGYRDTATDSMMQRLKVMKVFPDPNDKVTFGAEWAHHLWIEKHKPRGYVGGFLFKVK